jgi:serine phosphatase RsbU (regulator of sigma subunit)
MVRLVAENRRNELRLEELNTELQRRLDELESDQLAGRQVQLKMLPDSPCDMGEYRFEHRMFPSLFLSGDYVDYYTIGDHHTAFFIADVSGHGASSAFMTVLLKHLTARARSALWRLGDRTVLSPAASIQRLNDELLASRLGKHVTMFGGVLNRKSNVLRYCVAGHLPLPVLVSAEGARFLDGEGMPVGLFADAHYQDVRLRLPDSFSLLTCSDGLLEILPPPDTNDKEALLLSQFSAGDPGIDGLLEQLGLAEVDALPDDITLMRICRSGP